ncbi:MAG: 1-aminocyclopropane-1-carboxylate deaminase/D-cysteine desulfhydrase [Bacteroidetes bacterium]|nr:1-aminocyclopropane-1-carboxylate deaminase/D-cysteine desulfhydrase [Bacteroidota bacterium]HET6246004.1 pyridoxal-phosphate dependent enzyme [Bacteroidia bacterium]
MLNPKPVIQEIIDYNKKFTSKLFIKRDDMIDPLVSGNKWWKLKYNILEASKTGFETILTFGGAYSNHIAATAAMGSLSGLKTIGIIRGEEPKNFNPTLDLARKNGMQLYFIGRGTYREKNNAEFIKQLEEKFGPFYLIPEGGANLNGVKGCMEILSEVEQDYDYICCAMGTGTTMAGIVLSKKPKTKALGFSALKGGDFLKENVNQFLESYIKTYSGVKKDENWEIITDYHFGGYAKVKPELLAFINAFEERTKIPLDYIYTGKMMYGIYDMGAKGFFKPEDKILVIHSGGLQGNLGFSKIVS